MQDPTIHYAAAIEAVYNAHERYNIAVQTLADAETDLEEMISNQFQENAEAAAYVAAGSNEKARNERRIVWISDHLGMVTEAVRTAKAEKATAEMEHEHAKRLCNLARLRCEWMMAGGADLLGDEPPVSDRFPADPRWVTEESR